MVAEFIVNDDGCHSLAHAPAKLDTFPINLHHAENDTMSLFKIAVFEGDFEHLDERVDRLCRRLGLDHPACDSLRSALESRIIEQEVARSTAAHDPNPLAALVTQLHEQNQRLRDDLNEKAQAYGDLYRRTLQEKHELERRIRELEKQAKTTPHQVNEFVISASGRKKNVVKKRKSNSQRIDRHTVTNFTYDHYLEYARSFTPVIITGLQDQPGRPGLPDWNLDFLSQRCGDADVVLKRKKIHSNTTSSVSASAAMSTAMWAGIEQVAKVPLRDFLTDYTSENHNRTWYEPHVFLYDNAPSIHLYLHDMSVRKFCPQLLDSFVIPRYFADDRLQLLEHSPQRDYWPSLFIGDASTASALHADWAATSAWMGLLQGRKHWVIAKPTACAALFEQTPDADAPTEGRFAADWIHEYANASRYTRTSVEIYEDVLEAGEVLFIPANCPHQVQNLEKVCEVLVVAVTLLLTCCHMFVDQTLAVAANFVDSANVDVMRGYFTRTRQYVIGIKRRNPGLSSLTCHWMELSSSAGAKHAAVSKILAQLRQEIAPLMHDVSFEGFKAHYRPT
ncbi:TPA: hypothetical protein N0F65_007516 [Lagenidium giganteum]|uniref:JmjC domain-containing protein n=1 Tax=Lagenidium giganteum TaxID=4803 RepID=A0AAV2ZMS9_9STRA|nr:TPA: hypothetical protein N0F65_007516 [Lagenidium giganteum]